MNEEFDRLVESASRGDEEAVEVLLARYLPGLQAFVRLRAGRMLLARESCSDLAQSVCRDVLENVDRFQYRGEIAFKKWLFTTAMRKIADRYEYYRAAKRDVAREATPSPGKSTVTDLDVLNCYRAFYTPSQHAVAREELERAEQAFQSLPEDQQEVIVLAKVVGMSRAEIAVEMGRSEGAVRTLLHRSLAHLAELLEG
ncbi:MAG: sigma-70 family RNA polymerase sigma factor [Planctomycetes bacterium]|nr:sigma-70 family RNA polymerase sigma factor [Planctomycetota bacterium]MCB9891726.1 sigma-70 family RNA polymerase sigma factor [Planctomycetota bacterium]